MLNRRYPEGEEIPTLSFPENTELPTDKIRTTRRNQYLVPDNASDLMNTSSDARSCFVERAFSMKLQQFMINYSYTLVTSKVLSGEV